MKKVLVIEVDMVSWPIENASRRSIELTVEEALAQRGVAAKARVVEHSEHLARLTPPEDEDTSVNQAMRMGMKF